MCGIYGYLSRDDRPDPAILRRMGDALRHRGPDDACEIVRQGDAGSIALGHKRLSIIDLSPAGRQPMSNEDGRLWLTFNGEIYNFRELRQELVADGHCFKSNTDSEVILHLYEQMGTRCLDRLSGMFAFAIWDEREQSLFLARDRVGKKPLHYAEFDGGFAFASELKSLLQHPKVGRTIDAVSLNKYLTFEYVPAPHTIFAGMRKLEPGHFLIRRDGTTRTAAYWDLPMSDNPIAVKTEDAFAAELRDILDRAVRARLIADVPVGVFLSGGLDSSLVAALAARADPGIECFSIGFSERSFDESRHASRVAHALGLNHRVRVFSTADLLTNLDRLPDLLDEPLGDASILPSFLLAKVAGERLKVALSGDGGDELFAGYPTYQAHRLVTYYDSMPEPVRSAVRALASSLPVSHSDISTDFKIKQFLRGAGVSSEIRFFTWMGGFTESERRDLVRPEWRAARGPDLTYEDVLAYVGRSGLNKDLERILYLSMKLYLQDDILVKVDRASMANAFEVRCPLLDQELVEFACRLPMRYKLHGLTTKYMLKKAAAGLLPADVIHRRKKGFGMPVSKWLTSDLKAAMLDYLSEERLTRQGIFQYPFVKRLIDDHLARRKDNRKLLWTLLVFQMWYGRYIEHGAAA